MHSRNEMSQGGVLNDVMGASWQRFFFLIFKILHQMVFSNVCQSTVSIKIMFCFIQLVPFSSVASRTDCQKSDLTTNSVIRYQNISAISSQCSMYSIPFVESRNVAFTNILVEPFVNLSFHMTSLAALRKGRIRKRRIKFRARWVLPCLIKRFNPTDTIISMLNSP